MPLKKLPPEMSYAALREAHPPKASEREPASRKAGDEAKVSDERPGPHLKAVPEDVAEVSDATAEPAEENDPPADDTARTAEAESKPVENSAPKPPPTKAAEQRRRGSWATAKADRVTLRGYLPIPAEGVFKSFDEMAAIYGERKAFSLALTAGVNEYRKTLSGGKSSPKPVDYTSLTTIEVVRTVPVSFLDAARASLDPRGILGAYQLGGLVFKTALGLYLAKG